MNFTLTLEYFVASGEHVVVLVDGRRYEMAPAGNGEWAAEMSLTLKAHEYAFEIHKDGAVVRKEWHTHIIPEQGRGVKALTIKSFWRDRPANAAFYTSFFKDVVFHRKNAAKLASKGNVTFIFNAPEIRQDQTVAIAGSFDNWSSFLPMDGSGFPEWKVTLNVEKSFEYKFVVLDAEGNPVMWENSDNHHFFDVPAEGERVIVENVTPVFPTKPWRGTGVAVPVFSLRTEDSFGVGEFADLKKLADFAAECGMSVIQILPINDSTMTGTWTDSYPYNSNSSFALHPQYISLTAAGVPCNAAYKKLRKELNDSTKVEYEKVISSKLALLKKAFAGKGKKDLATEAYQTFFEQNSYWLLPYAVFCCLRDSYGTPDFSAWEDMAEYSIEKVEAYAKAHKTDVDFWCWVQHCLDEQLRDAVQYAHSKGLALKGDLPIGISRTSVDAWSNKSLFNLDSQAGAPPDAFSVDGQNWGFPTYNWEEMAKDGFAWWKNRLRTMNKYFDAFRIDHILGFFRIWEIPCEYKSGLMGHFNPALPYSAAELLGYGFNVEEVASKDRGMDVLFVEDPRKKGYWHPRISAQSTEIYNSLEDWKKEAYNNLYNDFFYHRHNDFWKDTAMFKLPELLESQGMLTCGEDLGMIPACVPSVMSALNILSLEIQRMPKSPEDEFADPARYPYWCVCATGTHDTSNVRAWWEEDKVQTQRFYNNMLGQPGEAPAYCSPEIGEMVIRQHLASPAMLVVLPLQDWLSIDGNLRYPGNPADERINIPAITPFCWDYRMHIYVENLLESTTFAEKLAKMSKEYYRE